MKLHNESFRDSATAPIHERLESIQALRGVAILLVLLVHAKHYEWYYTGDTALPMLYAGQSGVDLFFVISGFIMVTITRGIKDGAVRDIFKFLGKRVCRIYPPYWFYTLLMAPAFIFHPGFLHSQRMTRHINWLGTFTLYPTGVSPIILQSWSLSLEVYFYLVFAVILLFDQRLQPKILFGWALFVIAGYFLEHTVFSNFYSPTLDLLFHPMTLEFIGGCYIALLIQEGKLRVSPILLLVAGALCLVGGAFVASIPGNDQRVVLFGIPCLMILAGAVLCERNSVFNFSRRLAFIGDISYSIYLSHLMIYGILWRFWPLQLELGAVKRVIIALLIALAAIVFGALSYRFLEKPLLKYSYRTLRV